ncbi:MAG TPA: hypothetical protein VGW40_08380 [Allosphingosinicella sp.]|nr:hypothetical protein [Allosphingosinicella sp.]
MIELWSVAARIRSGLCASLLLVSLASLGACASFQAHPEPVLDTVSVVNSANINVRDVLSAFASEDPAPREGLTPKAYRDMVIGTYLMAADMRYLQFRRRLAAESRGSSLLLDIGILGLSGGASLATEATANALAAGAAGLTGTRAAVSRDIYFDRTIPAMIGVMDAERTRIRTLIVVNLRKSAEEYPLAVALSDVSSYEAAASLDAAIEILTREAADRVETANMNYADEVASYTGPPEAGVPEIMGRIRARLLALSQANDTTTLGNMAGQLNITVPAGTDANGIRRLIQAHMRGIQDLAGARALAQKLNIPTGG